MSEFKSSSAYSQANPSGRGFAGQRSHNESPVSHESQISYAMSVLGLDPANMTEREVEAFRRSMMPSSTKPQYGKSYDPIKEQETLTGRESDPRSDIKPIKYDGVLHHRFDTYGGRKSDPSQMWYSSYAHGHRPNFVDSRADSGPHNYYRMEGRKYKEEKESEMRDEALKKAIFEAVFGGDPRAVRDKLDILMQKSAPPPPPPGRMPVDR